MPQAVDNYGRPVHSLRIQVNTVCNFGCFFCHMEGTGVHSETMTPAEIERIVATAKRWGVNKVKFTGGEPTLRPDILEIIRRTRKHITGNISMTTNGIMLKRMSKELKEAGLDRVNISLHSIDRERFQFITGTDSIDQVMDGIRAAKEAGFDPIKINFVVLKDVNVDQIPLMIELSAREKFILQLIEFETTREMENSEEFKKYHVKLDPIEERLSRVASSVEFNDLHRRPRYHVPSESGEAVVEFVKPMRNAEFCNNCTRLRVTSTGYLKPCLMRGDNYDNILSHIRKNEDDKKLDDLFLNSVKKREPYWKKEDEIEDSGQVFWVSEG